MIIEELVQTRKKVGEEDTWNHTKASREVHDTHKYLKDCYQLKVKRKNGEIEFFEERRHVFCSKVAYVVGEILA